MGYAALLDIQVVTNATLPHGNPMCVTLHILSDDCSGGVARARAPLPG